MPQACGEVGMSSDPIKPLRTAFTFLVLSCRGAGRAVHGLGSVHEFGGPQCGHAALRRGSVARRLTAIAAEPVTAVTELASASLGVSINTAVLKSSIESEKRVLDNLV